MERSQYVDLLILLKSFLNITIVFNRDTYINGIKHNIFTLIIIVGSLCLNANTHKQSQQEPLSQRQK